MFLILALICVGCAPSPTAREQALITEAEKHVKLPQGAGELRCYKRYYRALRGKQLQEMFGRSDQLPARELLIGTYREPDRKETAGIEWVTSKEEVPKLYDGGCRDMTVLYADGWPRDRIKAMCSIDFSGNLPEKIEGKPLTC